MTEVLNLYEWKSDDTRKLSKICGRKTYIFWGILSLGRQEHKNIQEIPGNMNLELKEAWAKITGAGHREVVD